MSRSRAPDSKFSVALCQRVPKDDNTMLRQPHRRLQPSTPIIQCDQSSRQYAVRNDRFQLRIRNIVWKKEHWTETPSIVTTDEQVDITNMVRHQDNSRSRRMSIESLPQTNIVQDRSKRIQHQSLTIRLDSRRSNNSLPVVPTPPEWMPCAPDPEPRRQVPNSH